jgi:hypothetical protein
MSKYVFSTEPEFVSNKAFLEKQFLLPNFIGKKNDLKMQIINNFRSSSFRIDSFGKV